MKNSKINKVVKNLWVLMVIMGAGYYVYLNRSDFYSYLENVEIWRLGSSLAFLVIARILLYFQSKFSLVSLGETLQYKKLFSILSISQLGKYLPGGIWHIIGQFGMYRSNNLSNIISGKAMLLENIWIVLSAFFFGLIFLTISGRSFTGENGLFPLALWAYIPVLAIFILAIWITSIYLSLYFIAPGNPNRLFFSIKIFVYLFFNWMLFGFSFVVLFNGIAQSIPDLLLSIGGFAIGWVGGYIAVFAPGGVGIRELILAFLFSNLSSATNVSTVVIVHRLVWTIAEIIIGLAGWIVERTSFSDSKTPPQSSNVL